MTDPAALFDIIRGPAVDTYQEKVTLTYQDDPQLWSRAIGENLLFQWGIYNHPDSPRPVSLDEAGVRFFDRQLELAGVTAPGRPSPQRILDLGCGWGFTLAYLARLFPACPRLDGINISRQQLEHCARHVARQGTSDRTHLYLCNARDVDRLPDPGRPYDLVIIRGVITHFPNELYETSIRDLAKRVGPGGTLVISENLYNGDLTAYESAIPDETDRLACGHRKTPEYVAKVLEGNEFTVRDNRVLPSNTDVAHWLLEVRSNIETHFPEKTVDALEELRVLAQNLSIALLQDKFSAYSIIAERR
ncbi:class I SAM-dependent methyltransferase [Streptomyces sp. NPDC050617]|uniref:SAM-dependent methyltransferase n=1 Tax=Streptomyces sp. NPDC050617 TaxID=3154628 RepID=UPI00344A6A6C